MTQFEPIKELVLSIGGVLSKLTEHGFKPFEPPVSHSCPAIYINEQLGVVVKRSYLLGSAPQDAIPTLIVELPLDPILQDDEYGAGDEENFANVLIQPLADVSNQDKAYEELKAKGHEYGPTSDFGVRNVAFYNGAAVIIDW